mmetsp:Transcript_2572/g.3943  ORF Transcript_2572/g.3943 Transcript_2572/m.3943 type:complete len:218 (+) Transcript_2572:5191-5844(+)
MISSSWLRGPKPTETRRLRFDRTMDGSALAAILSKMMAFLLCSLTLPRTFRANISHQACMTYGEIAPLRTISVTSSSREVISPRFAPLTRLIRFEAISRPSCLRISSSGIARPLIDWPRDTSRYMRLKASKTDSLMPASFDHTNMSIFRTPSSTFSRRNLCAVTKSSMISVTSPEVLEASIAEAMGMACCIIMMKSMPSCCIIRSFRSSTSFGELIS